MRTHRRLLVSLTLNAVLAIALVWLHGRPRAMTPPPIVSPEAVTVRVEPQPTDSVVAAITNPAPIPFRWEMLDTNDLRVYVANLRSVHCPEHVLRELLVTKLDRQFRPQLRVTSVQYDPWVGADRREADRRKEQQRIMALRRDQVALIRELLGYDWHNDVAREWQREEALGLFLGFLPDAKAQQVMAVIMNSVQDLQSQFEFINSRIVTEEDVERFADFRRGLSAELAGYLNPAELDELETRAQLGLVFGELIHLDGFTPSGAELRAIMQTSRKYQDVVAALVLERFQRRETPEASQKWREFETALNASLGAARLAEFRRAQNEDFRADFKFTAGAALPPQVAVTLYQARQKAAEQRQEVLADRELTPEERKLALEVLQDATAGAIAQTLGRQFTNYLARGGQWLRQLAGSTPANQPVPNNR